MSVKYTYIQIYIIYLYYFLYVFLVYLNIYFTYLCILSIYNLSKLIQQKNLLISFILKENELNQIHLINLENTILYNDN